MATNLLLEGDDLEALLIKAQAEGGPNARIVRADKYRHGGLWGFFARERFEVAVEIPETGGTAPSPSHAGDAPAVGGPAFFLPGADESAVAPVPTPVVPPAPVTSAPVPRRIGPVRRTAAVPANVTGKVDVIGSDRAAAKAAAAKGSQRPAPTTSAVEVLLDMADRVSAAERAATRGSRVRPSTASLDLPAVEAVAAERAPELVGAVTPARAASGADGGPSLSTDPCVESGPLAALRPEFTALLDTLHHDTLHHGTLHHGNHPTVSSPTAPDPVRAAYLLQTADSGDQPDEATVLPARAADARAEADRDTLRTLGVPEAWTRRLRAGDRFSEVLRMLEHLPEPDIAQDADVVAVVGPVGTAAVEAHRTALDLASPNGPRPVVVVPVTPGPARIEALARAAGAGPVVVAVESDGSDARGVLDALATINATAVITVVDASVPLGTTQRWLGALGRVDALALERACEVCDPAAVLRLGLPVVRLDGIPIDRVTWTALLCAQLAAAEQRGMAQR